MLVLLLLLTLLIAGSILSFVLKDKPNMCLLVSFFPGIACAFGLGLSLWVMVQAVTITTSLPLPLPLGEPLLVLDPLAGFFLVPVTLLGLLGSVALSEQDSRIKEAVSPWRFPFFFCLLLFSIILVLVAADTVFFLLSWEIMSLCPFFLMAPYDRDMKERFGAWLYLIMAHLGALPLFLLFGAMSAETGLTAFSDLAIHGQSGGWGTSAGLFFLFALVGFGAKLGLFPLQGWMPESYPVLPAPAVMVIAGGMVNVGFYGLLRMFGLLGPAEPWWGICLMAVGAVSGLAAVFFAFVQPNMKRVLAYSSSENMGIVTLGLGAAVLSCFHGGGLPLAFFLGGSLLHLWNHSLFKGMLYLGANTVERATGTTQINRLGGLAKKMPRVAVFMALGCAAIAGVPPFNGFVGELMLYTGFATDGGFDKGSEVRIVYWIGLWALGSIGGFALFCFTRFYCLVFAGTPRSSAVNECTEPYRAQECIMGILAVLCVLAALGAPLLHKLMAPVVQYLTYSMSVPGNLPVATGPVDVPMQMLVRTSLVLGGLILLCLVLYIWKKRLKAMQEARYAPTWDCAYAAPSERMQYTGGSFVDTGLKTVSPFLRPVRETPKITAIFPKWTAAKQETTDWSLFGMWATITGKILSLAEKGKILQFGLVNAYILYILLALLVALVWALGDA